MRVTRRNILKTGGIAALSGLAISGGMSLTKSADAHTALAQGPEQFQRIDQGDIHIAMGEFYFQVVQMDDGEISSRSEQNAPIELPSGQELLVRFFNEGNDIHEAHFGRNPDPDTLKSYQENLFGGGPAGSGFVGIHLNPGQEGFLHLWLPESSQGEWEIGCFIPGHYGAGMHAPLNVT